ncbi:MAG: hypothetical protein JHC33_09045 [Ignisphaera sp.]|nr:hypothetical protein [Ignisphaera sp.]
MKNSIYLYGSNFDSKTLRELNYVSALHRKIEWATETINEILTHDLMIRDFKRINDITKAISFNRKLIQECYDIEED